jgi:hypothetical protein
VVGPGGVVVMVDLGLGTVTAGFGGWLCVQQRVAPNIGLCAGPSTSYETKLCACCPYVGGCRPDGIPVVKTRPRAESDGSHVGAAATQREAAARRTGCVQQARAPSKGGRSTTGRRCGAGRGGGAGSPIGGMCRPAPKGMTAPAGGSPRPAPAAGGGLQLAVGWRWAVQRWLAVVEDACSCKTAESLNSQHWMSTGRNFTVVNSVWAKKRAGHVTKGGEGPLRCGSGAHATWPAPRASA